MTDTTQTTSTSKDNAQTSGFKFPFGNCQDMIATMQNCCGSGEDSSDCCENMQQMCGDSTKEADTQ